MSDNLRARAEEIVDAKIKFLRNFKAYIIVNAILAVLNFFVTPDFWWVCFPLFFWGIGVIADILKAFVFIGKFDSEEYRQRKIEDEIERLRN